MSASVSIPRIVREETAVVRTRTFACSAEIDSIVEELRNGRCTGKLSINLSQGGVTAVTFEDFQKIS